LAVTAPGIMVAPRSLWRTIMKLVSIRSAVLAAALFAAGCGSNSSPTTAAPTPTNTTTVSIVGIQGNSSFVPNPIPVAAGGQVMFKNNDPVNTHHIVMDDNSVDFGSLAPGTSSPARAVTTGNFHCANHPSMVGSINGATAPTPPPGSGNGY
jgi:plastocyanin